MAKKKFTDDFDDFDIEEKKKKIDQLIKLNRELPLLF